MLRFRTIRFLENSNWNSRKILLFGAMQHGYEKCNNVVSNMNVWQQYVWDTYWIVGEWAWLWSARKYRRSQIITPSGLDNYVVSKTLQPHIHLFSGLLHVCSCVCVFCTSLGLKVIQLKSYCNYSVPGSTQCCQTWFCKNCLGLSMWEILVHIGLYNFLINLHCFRCMWMGMRFVSTGLMTLEWQFDYEHPWAFALKEVTNSLIY